ncbi:MAG: hypothetical protein ACXU88_08955 [Myxococcaceae bacterium]
MAPSPPRPERVPDLKPGKYSDGHPLDEVQYLECKIILKPERFVSRKSFWDFAKLLRPTAKTYDASFSSEEMEDAPVQIREVLFIDTTDFRLYNNAFILRRRIPYKDGFPIGDPEIVFKYRHPDMQKAAEIDVRPNIIGDYRIKFKTEALPLKEELGGYRLLFSHNVEFGLSKVQTEDRLAMDTLIRVLPALAPLKKHKNERVELVSDVIVEEVLQDLGIVDFGKGISGKANVALWRARGDHRPLVGEFAYQLKFKRRDDLHEKAIERCKGFFCALQRVARDWVSLGTTKTGVVYRLKGNRPKAHE